MAVEDALLWVTIGLTLLVLLAVLLRLGDLRRRLDALPKDEEEIVTMLQRIDADAADMSRWSNNAEERLRRLEDQLPDLLKRATVIRYDGFPDIRGNLSRSVALLDQGGSGLVITVLVNRDTSLFFLKAVTDGKGEEPLSPEEMSAVDAVRRG